MATEEETAQAGGLHGGRLVAKRLVAHGVSKLFTLSGGHIFSIYDGCREEGIEIIDTRHEQTAAFAAEGWAKATRQPGVAALTAGPGVTNAMSALASSLQNGSPVVTLGGRAPAMRWGQGSLQEIDHVPFVSPVTRFAHTVESTAEIPRAMDAAFAAALGPPSGPAFVDFPLDHVFMESDVDADSPARAVDHRSLPAAEGIERGIELLRGARRPVIMAGTGLYWAHGEGALRALAEEAEVPVFVNGLGRGCMPADHELFFSRARGKGLTEADVAWWSACRWTSGWASARPLARTPRSWCWTPLGPTAVLRARPPPSSSTAGYRRAWMRCATGPPRALTGISGCPRCASSSRTAAPASTRS